MTKLYNSLATAENVGVNSALEELCLRRLDQLFGVNDDAMKAHERNQMPYKDFRPVHDPRALSLARTHLQEAFAWLHRAVVNPERIETSSNDLLSEVTRGLAKDDPSIEVVTYSIDIFRTDLVIALAKRMELACGHVLDRLTVVSDDNIPAFIVRYKPDLKEEGAITLKVPKGAPAVQVVAGICAALKV